MKKVKISCSSSNWSETEKEVAEIIRDLYRVCLLSSVPFSWRCKRKRSSIQNKVSSSPNKRICTFNGGRGSVVLKCEASSPATPLLFPASESDEKIKHSKIKISLKKKKESSVETIEDLTKTKTLLNQKKESSLKTIEDLMKNKTMLNQEIEKVKKYHDQLKIFNLNLKLRKQELLCKSNLENRQKVKLDHEAKGLVNTSESKAENEEQKQQHQPQNNGLSSTGLGRNQLQDNGLSSAGLGRNIMTNNDNGPISPPAPNLPSDETRANRVIAATQARQRRLNIIRLRKREQRLKNRIIMKFGY